jgi:ABC-type Co2+ transport system permease subunit
MGMFNVGELIKRIVKYMIEGLMIAIVAYVVPKRSLNLEEIALLALTAAATFAILDSYIPSMGVSARQGTGLGVGLHLAGF